MVSFSRLEVVTERICNFYCYKLRTLVYVLDFQLLQYEILFISSVVIYIC